jgi:hypothetical protein
MKRAFAGLVIGLVLMVVGTGCAFDRKWRAMKRAELVDNAPAADGLAGRWEGRWVSDANGHSGGLRAIITPAPQTLTADRHYHAEFDASYMGLLRFGYGMTLVAKTNQAATGGHVSFHGEEDLGAMAGGLYRYNGTADGTTFNATYESKDDKGRFEMSRPRTGE